MRRASKNSGISFQDIVFIVAVSATVTSFAIPNISSAEDTIISDPIDAITADPVFIIFSGNSVDWNEPDPAVVISSLSISSASEGERVTITGSGFTPEGGTVHLISEGAKDFSAPATFVDATHIIFFMPEGVVLEESYGVVVENSYGLRSDADAAPRMLVIEPQELRGILGEIGGNTSTSNLPVQTVTLRGPFDNLEGFTFGVAARKIIEFLFVVGAPLATIMILIGGYYMITAGGSSEKFGTGKKTILYAAVGLAIILLSEGVAIIIEAVFK